MTAKPQKPLLSHDDVLEKLADGLDISPSLRDDAVDRYGSLGKWLERRQSELARYNPEISPQGSFLLGLVTRPLSDADEYDVDLVCRINASKDEFTQKELKEAVGREVLLYAQAQSMKEKPGEGRRCWTLHYAGGARFHMDVLPAIPDAVTFQLKLHQRGFIAEATDADIVARAIAITDNTLLHYDERTNDWPLSNPLGYAAWFRNRMLVQLLERKEVYRQNRLITASVDDIPDHKVKTPLQRAIQLLKRHRDFMFEKNADLKPISIIITTLAAHAYNNESSLSQTLQTILRSMDSFIDYRGDVAWIPNPVNPVENFADKWAEDPKKQEKFYKWLEQARSDFALYLHGKPF